jgi:hypothetical protein
LYNQWKEKTLKHNTNTEAGLSLAESSAPDKSAQIKVQRE